jgi:hypothetical protein
MKKKLQWIIKSTPFNSKSDQYIKTNKNKWKLKKLKYNLKFLYIILIL